MRRIFLLLPIVAFGLLTSCAQKTSVPVPPKVTVTPVKKQQSAFPDIREAQDLSREANKRAAVVQEKLKKSQEDLDEYQDRVVDLGDTVGKLKDAGTATQQQLDALFDEVSQQEGHIEKLVNNLKAVSDELIEEQRLRREAQERLDEIAVKAAAKEQEAEALRSQLDDAKLTSDAYWEAAKENEEAAKDARSDADVEVGKRKLTTKILIGVGVLLLLSLGANYLQLKGIL